MKSTVLDSAASGAEGCRRRSRRPARLAALAAGAALALGVAACGAGTSSSSGGSSSSGSKAGSTLTIADVSPFSGTDAEFGPSYLAACYAATGVINNAGGVLGHKFNCKSVDTRGEPADAVPAVNQMYASTPNLGFVIGCSSDEAASVVPIFTQHKTVSFCMTGQSEFDQVHYPYFFRLVPPDVEEAYADVVIAQQKGYKRVALAYGNDIGSQAFVHPATTALKHVGIGVTTNQTLDVNGTTFRTEADAIIRSHPDAIITEALGNADPTLFSEIKQLNGGKMIPVIGTGATISPPFYKAAAAAMGATSMADSFVADNLVVLLSGPAYKEYQTALLAQKGKVPGTAGNFNTYLSFGGTIHLYDGVNLAALAMLMSKSTSPDVYKADIIKIGNGVPGATVCHSFTTCASLIKSGKAARYEGPGGATNFDSFHDSTGLFQIDKYTANGSVQVIGNITPAQLRAVSG